MADCPGCGGVLRYDISSETVICDYCRQAYRPEALDTTQMAEETDRMGVQAFHCPNCGGEIFSTDHDVTGVCSYCGSNVVFESRLVSKRRPQLIIPFRKTREECREIYARFLKRKLFVPKELKNPEYIESLRGIYMPYWISDVTQKGQVRFYSQASEEKGQLIFDDTYRIEGELDAEYDHFYHDGGSAFSDDLSEKLEPYLLFDAEKQPQAKPFYPAYLSGFYAEPADLDFAEYQEYFEDLADRQTAGFLSQEPIVKGVVDTSYPSYAGLDLLPPLDPEAEALAAEALAGQKAHEAVDRKKLREREKLEEAREKQLDEACKTHTDDRKEIPPSEAYHYQTVQKASMALFPVWFMAWRKKDRVAYLSINGQTGRVCADLPIDYFGFFRMFALITVICFAVFSLFTINVYMMPVLAAWLSAVVLHMEALELEAILERSAPVLIHKKRKTKWNAAEVGITGLVLVALFPVWYWILAFCTDSYALATDFIWRVIYAAISLIYAIRVFFKCLSSWRRLPKGIRMLPVFILEAAAAVFSFVVVVTNSPRDQFLYGCSAAAFLAIAITLLTMLRQYNISATRPLPQLEHRGGDDLA